ncbi:MAG TPA: TRAP transporter substrate-binding protein [Ramlibacter sp.]|jgi:TRAP-type C4-dicarboxylate transport system substrate-binding protein|uniref:TRAP transporter substrate-binding protein n=1 Tax=Ramlibacter sp. TaxID=1917967 RepID=UPI002D30EA3D|nr:TRAP transporter substrate-binding protein [Ramlibacter sp.]HZY17964.1 TRAP transporter substrate-binding protein [Ramlibacter sp.]
MHSFVLAAALAVLLAQPCAARSGTAWNLATGYRAETFHTINLAEFAQEVEGATGGELRIRLHPNNSLARLADIPRAVQDGRAEAGETIMTNLAGEMPMAGVDSIPFLVGTYADARRLWTLQRPLVEKRFAAQGLRVLYAVPWPPQGLFTSRPVRGSADFAGTRMRTYNGTTLRIAQMLGATPVDVPMVEVSRALASGTIDSMITSAVTGVENAVWGPIKHYYEINAWFPKNVVFVAERAFSALPPPQQRAVLQAAQAAEARGWERSQAILKESTDVLRAHGIRIERAPPEFEADLRRMGDKFSREWVRSVGNEANAIFVPYYTQ